MLSSLIIWNLDELKKIRHAWVAFCLFDRAINQESDLHVVTGCGADSCKSRKLFLVRDVVLVCPSDATLLAIELLLVNYASELSILFFSVYLCNRLPSYRGVETKSGAEHNGHESLVCQYFFSPDLVGFFVGSSISVLFGLFLFFFIHASRFLLLSLL